MLTNCDPVQQFDIKIVTKKVNLVAKNYDEKLTLNVLKHFQKKY